MKTATQLIAKRMGHGKCADLNGKERLHHEGDAKRTLFKKTVSKIKHNRKTKKSINTYNIRAQHERELLEYYGIRF